MTAHSYVMKSDLHHSNEFTVKAYFINCNKICKYYSKVNEGALVFTLAN